MQKNKSVPGYSSEDSENAGQHKKKRIRQKKQNNSVKPTNETESTQK